MSLPVEKALRKAQSHIKAGELAEAEEFYKQVLSKFPKNKKAIQGYQKLKAGITLNGLASSEPSQEQIQELINLYNQGQFVKALDKAKPLIGLFPHAIHLHNIQGACHAALQRYDAAIDSYKQAIKIKPDYAEAYNNMGNALKDKGELDAAIDNYKQAIKIKPDYAEAYSNMGNVLKEKGELNAAIDSYKQAIKIKPDYVEAYYNMGAALKEKGELDASIDSYKQAIKIKPDYAEAYYNMGNVLKEKGELNAAIDSYKQAIKIKPDYAEAYSNMGNVLKEKGELNAAIDSYKQAIKIKPDYAEAYSNMGVALKEKGELDAAIDSYEQAIKIKPEFAEASSNMGVALKEKGELDAAIDSYKQAIKIKPDYAEAYSNMGIALKEKGELDAAIDSYKQAIKIKPDYAEAYYNMGNALKEKGELDAAIDSYKQAIKIKPDYELARSAKLHQQAHICDWEAIERDRELLPKLGTSIQHVDPLLVVSLEDAPERHRLRSEIYAKNKFSQKPLPLAPRSTQKPKRLRIGYFSSDLKEHPVAYLMAKVIETHDRGCFEVYGYSTGPAKEDEMRRRLVKGFDVFNDVRDMSDRDIVLLARQDKLDIAIDLTGHTKHSRSGAFAYHLAPIQINYLGYPGTMGADFFDYIIADQNLIPKESQKYYSEKPIYLPHHYQAQDDTLHISDDTPSRSELGLPDKCFVFCAINNVYKITSSEFDIWMRLLQSVDGSVLWLLESNKWVKGNLLKEAHARGVASERLVFAKKVPHDKYLAQFRQADLYLDTFTYNAGATASNALWAGLPVLTKLGKGYTARMAGSLLSSIGLSELITDTKTEYEELAFKLATNPERLASIKQKLAANRLSKPLFNTELFTKHLDAGYQMAYQQYANGREPQAIYVPE